MKTSRTFRSEVEPSYKPRPRRRLSRWDNWWIIPAVILLDAVILFLARNTWLVYAAAATLTIAIAALVVLFWLRWRLWPKDKLSTDGRQIYYGPYSIHTSAPRRLIPATQTAYISICARYLARKRANPDLVNKQIAAALDIDLRQLNRALHAWRTGQLDDRPRWPRLADWLAGRHLSDETRYLPPAE